MATKTDRSLQSAKARYHRLRQSLCDLGYISQGSVLDRSTLHPPRGGYQWTRKVGQKTITVALTAEQFQSLSEAIKNGRKLRATLRQLEALSRQILFATLPHTGRRKRLSKKVLGLI